MNRILVVSKDLLHPIPGILQIIFLLALSASTVFGQGTVKGVVTDKADNTPLIAATVVVEGTTIGTVTNYNGEYILPLKAGSYTLQVSYMGYETIKESVTLEDGQMLEFNASLAAVAIMGEEVVVTMQARGQLAAVNQQLRSNQIINVVSAERIRELPDENAAQAISRLPGVHLDGSRVVIRGLEPKMNKIMINGIEMPATEQENRATDLGMVSANLLSGIEVIKTLTPDMPADAIGGIVNLRLREAQQGLHYSLTAQGGYNQQEKYMGNYKLWGDVSNRFLDNKLGVIVNLNYERRNYGDDRYSNTFSNFANSTEFWDGNYHKVGTSVYDQFNSRDDLGASLVLDYDLPGGQIVYSGMLNHSSVDEIRHHDDMDWAGQRGQYHQLHLDRSSYKRMILSNTLRYEQQIGIVGLDASISNTFLDHQDDFRYRFRFGQAAVQNFIVDSVSDQNIMQAGPWDFYDWLYTPALDMFRAHDANYTNRTFNENQWIAELNVKVPVRITDNINIDLKAGGRYKKIDRNYDEMGLGYSTDNWAEANQTVEDFLSNTVGHSPIESGFVFEDWRDYDYAPNDGFMNDEGARMYMVMDVDLMDELWSEQMDMNLATTPMLLVQGMARNDYWGFENHAAAYIMGEINLGKRLTIIPGVRYEQAHNEYSAPKIEYLTMSYWTSVDTLTKPADHANWLPHLHLRFRATDWWDIRLSYNNTLTRPDYNYAIPSVYYNLQSSQGEAGNPYIKPATSENLDANFTFYSRKLGLLTLGGFYKRMNDVFYMQETILKNIPDSTIRAEFPIETNPSLLEGTTNFYLNSPYEAIVKGLEFEWQSNFTWLPSPFNGIVLNANYTHVWSDTKYMLHRVLFVYPPGSWIGVPTESDTFYTNRLLHQADDIANFSLGYDYKGFSARLSFRFQGNVVSAVRTLPALNEYTDNEYKFDFVVKQKIATKYGDVEIFLNAINFTNVPYRRFVDYPVQSGGESNLRRSTTYMRYRGRHFQLGLRFRY